MDPRIPPWHNPGPRPYALFQCYLYNSKRSASPGIVQQGCTTLQGYTETSKWFLDEHSVPFCRLWVPKDLSCGLLGHEGARALLEYPVEHQWSPQTVEPLCAKPVGLS